MPDHAPAPRGPSPAMGLPTPDGSPDGSPRGGPTGIAAPDVFEILIREHADMLCAFLRSLVRRPEVVDDLFQQTALVAWRRLGDYDRARPFGPWLRGIAARVAMAHRRKAAHDFVRCEPGVIEALGARLDEVNRLPGDTFAQRAAGIRGCLDQLPAGMRDAVEMAYERGMLLKQIAAALSSSEEAIKKRVQRARVLLADCLRRALAAHHAGHQMGHSAGAAEGLR